MAKKQKETSERAKLVKTLANNISEVNKGGRPRKYDELFLNEDGTENAEAFKLLSDMSMSGMTDEQMAKVLGITRATVHEWKKDFHRFSDTIEENKQRFDNGAVKRSLYERATGFEIEEEKIFIVNGKPLRVPVKKFIVPDTTAQQYWLNNRQADEWRSVNHIDYSNRMPSGLDELDLSLLNEEDLELLEYLVKKASRAAAASASDQ